MRIGTKEIVVGAAPFIIAELGVNHDGSVERALELTEAARDCGADAIKLQCFEARRLLSKAARLAAYQREAGASDPFEMLVSLELGLDDMRQVVDRAHDMGMAAIVTVFSVELVEPAGALPWDAFKIASPDIINRPLIEALAALGKPMILSTGASTLQEVMQAVSWIDEQSLAVLQCVSSYPTTDEDAALGGIAFLARQFGGRVPIGYSDHLVGERSGAWAVSQGAAILEKHLTYDPAAAGPDHASSLAPAGFRTYVELAHLAAQHRHDVPESRIDQRARHSALGTRHLEGLTAPAHAIGDFAKRVLPCEKDVRLVSRQSLTTTRRLPVGHVIAANDLTIKRPGTGLPPFQLRDVIGRTSARTIEADMPICAEDLA